MFLMDQAFSREKTRAALSHFLPRIPSGGAWLLQQKDTRGLPLEVYSLQEKAPATSWTRESFAQMEGTASTKPLPIGGKGI